MKGFTLLELLIVVAIIAILAGLLLPALIHAICLGREGAARTLVTQIVNACKFYETNHGVYPPGDGSGSARLVRALSRPSSRNIPYYEFRAEDVLNDHIRNPVWTDEILYYRRNDPHPPADAKNPYSFDIWGADCRGDPEGISNW
ncbi:MAG: type II secretion system protein [Planctomycetota bacterium]|jgi:prepilin-type N-terminal cleavage/methylation domain-containing protein